ncbi:MAG: YfiR/HmsC family protein [Candidatus Aminicenantes bacterium]
MLTLKLFSQNIYFKREAKTITIGSDSKEFLAALESKQTVIKGVKIKSLLVSANNSQEDMDVAFIDNIELADKIAGNGILVFSSNEKCSTAAFIITVNRSNRLRITYNKRNIKNQGAAFPPEVFKTLDKYQAEK